MPVDVLSEVLSAVRLTGSVYFDVTATSPWVAEAQASAEIAGLVMPGAQHAIEYHVITKGSCWISIVGGEPFEPVRLEEGDIAVIPHGEPHTLSSSPGMRADAEDYRWPGKDDPLPFKLKTGVQGPVEFRVICGFFTCDARPFNPLLEALPRFMRFGRASSGSADGLLEQFIRFASAETNTKRAGSQSILNRLSELMFVETIRMQMEQLAATN